ncbi:MAG: hypothetical protein R3F60_24930 [bacterium]
MRVARPPHRPVPAGGALILSALQTGLVEPGAAFAALVERVAADYFGELLPRCLDAWLAGRGIA